MSYDVKPLNWIGDAAATPFGSYTVGEDSTGWYWHFDFGYPDEDSFQCDSRDEGRHAAWCHWLGRLTEVLTPSKGTKK